MTWAIYNIFFEISPLNQISYLLIQFKTILGFVLVVSVELTIFVLISFTGVGFDLPRPLYELLIFYLREYFGYGSIERR